MTKAVCLSNRAVEISEYVIPSEIIRIGDIKKLTNFQKHRVYKKFNVDEYTIAICGTTTGRAKTENKHELPPPLDKKLFFGNVYVFKTKKDGSILEFSVNDYKRWLKKAFLGFEILGDEDSERSEDSESEGSLCEFIVNDEEVSVYSNDSNDSDDMDGSDYITESSYDDSADDDSFDTDETSKK